ncbi:hypothetical protein BC828DRAFT_372214 [Blastocladiella britannica]|nr:hypothetical protein BC828DRAFT_372214 [Blastocladiella britannica]
MHFSIILLLTKGKRMLARNHRFIGHTIPVYLQWTVFFALIGLTMIMAFDPPEHIAWDDHILLLGLFCVRNVTIAFKYAFCSPIELARMEEEFESWEVQRQRQILTGWISPDPSSIELQILLASTRQSLDLTAGNFTLCQAPTTTEPVKSELKHETALVKGLQLRYAAYLDSPALVPTPLPSPPPTTPTTAVESPTFDSNIPPPPSSLGAASKFEQQQKTQYLSAYTVVYGLVTEAIGKAKPFNRYMIASLTYAALPIIIRGAMGEYMMGGSRWTAFVYTFFAFQGNWMLLSLNYGFVKVCVRDFQRREILFCRLKAILVDGFVYVPGPSATDGAQTQDAAVDPAGATTTAATDAAATAPSSPGPKSNGDKSQQPAPEPVMQRINMDSAHNLQLWWYTRMIIQDFGRPFLLRLQTYTGSFIVFSIVVTGILLLYMMGYLPDMSLSFQVHSIYLLISLLYLLTYVLTAGLRANLVRGKHATELYKKAITLSTRAERVRETDAAASNRFQDAASLCWVLAEAVKNDEAENALRVFGFAVDTSLLSTFGTVMTAGISIGLNALRSAAVVKPGHPQ